MSLQSFVLIFKPSDFETCCNKDSWAKHVLTYRYRANYKALLEVIFLLRFNFLKKLTSLIGEKLRDELRPRNWDNEYIKVKIFFT